MQSKAIDTLAVWHATVQQRDPLLLDDLLAEDVVFHSPVVHKPQLGKALTALYLRGALHVLGGADQFRYVRQIVGERDALLEFTSEIDGVHINGIDLIAWNADGRITDFKVMVRPMKAMQALHAAMGALLPHLQAVHGQPPAEFAQFEQAAHALGYDEVLVREWGPGLELPTHSHPFEVRAWVVHGELKLSCGDATRVVRAGEGFELAQGTPHAESYGSEGAIFWAARRHRAGAQAGAATR
jgi:quercetin dioxygenase-like cupin family protein